MRRYLAVTALAFTLALALTSCATDSPIVPLSGPPPQSGAHVRVMRTMFGDAATPGMDEIAALIQKIPGVTLVQLYEYYQTQQVADDIMTDAQTVAQVLVGGSCGANSVTLVAAGVPRPIAMLASIQESQWCGGVPIAKNVLRAVEVYDPNCLDTAGLGCKEYVAGAGEPPSRITIVDIPECHPCSFVDPTAQNVIIQAVRSVTDVVSSKKFVASVSGRRVSGVRHVVLQRGQSLY